MGLIKVVAESVAAVDEERYLYGSCDKICEKLAQAR
jgi:hypothetical protein